MRRASTLAILDLAFAAVTILGLRAMAAFGPTNGRFHQWYEDAPADVLVATAGAAVLAAIACWLTGATTLQLLADVVPARGLRGIADRLAPAALRSVGRTVADVALGAAVLLAPLPSEAAAPAPVAELVDDAPGTATLRPVGPTVPEPAPATNPMVEPVAVVPAEVSVVVVTGDSFWSIAEGLLSARLGRPASDGEVDDVWRLLMAGNADRLVVPGNFDLLYPGQVLALPDGEPGGGSARLAETL